MKTTIKLLIILSLIGCSSSSSIITKEPYLYSLENANGAKTIVKSHMNGIISENDFLSLKEYLIEISDYKIDVNNKIVINFIDNDPTIFRKNFQVPWDIFYGNMEKELNSIEPCNHFWILNKNVTDLYYYHGNKINWIIDKDNIVRELFFKYNGLNGGFIIMKQNGEYFLKVGEYIKSDVSEVLKEFK